MWLQRHLRHRTLILILQLSIFLFIISSLFILGNIARIASDSITRAEKAAYNLSHPRPYTFLGLARLKLQKTIHRLVIDQENDPGRDVAMAGDSRRILLATTFRTGSSFLGQMLAKFPGVFYTFEPLIDAKEDKFNEARMVIN